MRRLLLFLTLSAALLAAALAAAPAAAQEREQCFEPHFCISGAIQQYWASNGGAAVFGYPISDVHIEKVVDEGRVWNGPVQWFERDRLEDHTADRAGVLAGRLGVLLLAARGQTFSPVAIAEPGCRYFTETHHSLCEPFLSHWQSNGEVPRFGFPITEQFQEMIEGKTYTVQYFERRRMEYHADEPGALMVLGRLGYEVRALLCMDMAKPESPAPAASDTAGAPTAGAGCAAAPIPPANADITGPKAGDQVYTFEIKVNSSEPETIRNVDVLVYDDQHQESYRKQFEYQTGKILLVDIPKNQLKTSGEYIIVVRAKDKNDKDIPTQDGKVDLATVKFGHTLAAAPKLPTVAVSVLPIEKEDGQDVLPVKVDITDEAKQLAADHEYINSTVLIFHNGSEIKMWPVKGFDLANPLIRVPLKPDELKPDQEYSVVVEIDAPRLAPIKNAEPLKFRPVLPPPPTFWQVYVLPVISNPITIGGALFVIFLVALVLIYTSQPRKRAIPNPIYSAKTFLSDKYKGMSIVSKAHGHRQHGHGVAFANAQPGPRLKVAVIQTADPAQRREELVPRFPYVIGREGADLLILGDTKVSRCHAEISARGGKIIIKDLNSANGIAFVMRDPKGANGSFVVKTRLVKGGSAEWDNRSLIRLGPNTVLKLERLKG